MRLINSVNSSLGQHNLLADLEDHLKKGQVLYLVSGGSNIQIVIAVLKQLDEKLTANLNILLADERYGVKGHKDSNFTQFMEQGLDLKQASFPDILDRNLNPEETADRFTRTYEDFKKKSSFILGQLGIGDDGHIAGVLPYSPAIKSSKAVEYYESKPYKRLTLSLSALRDINKTYVFCFGGNKKATLEHLKASKGAVESLPSLFLKEMADVTVYNDQL